MPYWFPMQPIWAGQDAFVIGGGASLRGFDWELLRGKNTVGCNMAYKLGMDICKVVMFSDFSWFKREHADLAAYPGMIVTHDKKTLILNDSRVHVMAKQAWGLSSHALAYNGNSGCAAAHLALIFGAQRVYLLGLDCKRQDAHTSHWHQYYGPPRSVDAVYKKFIKGWGRLNVDLAKVYPGRAIINLGPDSDIPYFPTADYNAVLRREVVLA